ncbi:MAG: FtsX-like permease family protein [Cytophagia bacterium]|nr:FtsX-like permease family protein [Cytophagia bacterium]
MDSNQTPRFWTRIFKWFCQDHLFEELQGDLEESFIKNTNTRGLKKAKSIYKKEVLKMVRASVFKKVSLPSFINQAFISHYLKVSFRNLKKHLAYSLLNTVGFAAALAVCLFCINAIYSNQQLDQKFSDKERVYRVSLKLTDAYGTSLNATSQIPLAHALESELPEVESIGFIQIPGEPPSPYLLKGTNVGFNINKVNEEFFDIFDFEMILGNPKDLFTNPKNIIITKKVMDTYFDPETVIGQQLGKYIISGVIEDPSKVSHLDFEIINSQYNDHNASSFYSSWSIYSWQQLYIKLKKNAREETVANKLKAFSANLNKELNNDEKGTNYEFVLEPLTSVAQSEARFNKAPLFNKTAQKMAKILIVVLLSIAAFNYTNLAMASSLSRTKEVGVRKVMGSKKSQLIYQFLIETTILTLFGFGFGLLIFKLLAPSFSSFSEFTFQTHLSFGQVAIFFLFSLGVALVSGIIPGLFFSRISILGLFKQTPSRRKFSLQSLKKGLIVFQVSLSLLVFTLGFILINQAKLITSQKTPYTGENMVAFELPFEYKGAKSLHSFDSLNTTFRNDLLGISGIESVARLGSLPFSATGLHSIKKHHFSDSYARSSFRLASADSSFLKTFEPSIEWFVSKEYIRSTPYFLVNDEFDKTFSDSIKTIREATYSLGTDEYYPVLGKISNLNFGDPATENSPSAILIDNSRTYTTLAIKLTEASFGRTLSEIEALFAQHFPAETFYPIFVDELLKNRLSQFRNIIKAFVFVFSSIIAITLMGQIGMAMYNAQTKEKEIGIRKVLGASFSQISGILLRSTYIQLIIAGAIACPLAYLIFNEVKPDFSIPLVIEYYHLLAAFVLFALLIITLVTSQTWKTSQSNPTEILRNE